MKFINKLPRRFQWTIHNVIAHPLMELFYQLGFEDLSSKIHDMTVPNEQDNQIDNSLSS